MILTDIKISPELLIKLVSNKLRMWGRGTSLGYLVPLGKSSASLGKSGWKTLGDQWRGMASHKSQKRCAVRCRVPIVD